MSDHETFEPGKKYRFMPGDPAKWLAIARDADGYVRGEMVKINHGTAQVIVKTKAGFYRPMYVTAARLERLSDGMRRRRPRRNEVADG